MIEYRSLKILLMAGVASGRQACELPSRRVFVAVDALQEGMRTDQRKTILVVA